MEKITDEAAWKKVKRQRILEVGFKMFSEKGIVPVTMPDIARESGVGRATLYRYYATKLDLVIAIGTWKWQEYIDSYKKLKTGKALKKMTGAQLFGHFLDSFIDLYHNHADILRFNYDFNSFLMYERGTPEQKKSYLHMVDGMRPLFDEIIERGMKDGTLAIGATADDLLYSSFHIMLAAVTRFAVGLVYLPDNEMDPVHELIMLEDMLLSRYFKKAG